jgi:hypothetical protein
LEQDNAPSHTSFFIREFLTKNNTTVISHPTYFYLFVRLRIKLKVRHFDTIDMIEPESQAVLNTFTGRDFWHAFKKWQKLWNGAYSWKGITLSVMVASMS